MFQWFKIDSTRLKDEGDMNKMKLNIQDQMIYMSEIACNKGYQYWEKWKGNSTLMDSG